MAAFGSGGFGNRGGFGQSTSAFGSTAFGSSNAPFGGQSTFGSQSNPLFGSQPQSFSAFGQSAPFGGTSFGVQTAPAFGSGFGGQSTSAFGSGFGAQSSGAFGASGGFGSGTSLFGANRPPTGALASSNPFGQSQSAWGQSSSAFGGSTAFGSGGGLFGSSGPSSSVFGQTAGAFGVGSQDQKGTVGATWQITTEYDSGPNEPSKYHSITMMNQFRSKSIEELRVEDYAAGNMGGTQGGGVRNLGAAQSGGLFGRTGNAFGATTGGFGSGNAFATTGGLWASSSATGFDKPSGTGVFGGGGLGASSGFGQSSVGGFGGGGTFGAQSGGIFGQPGSTFGAQSGGGFGNTGGALFGSGSGFGGQQSGGLFGASGGGGFGAQQSQPAFGGGNTQSGMFGAPSQPAGNTLFGAQSTPSLFGGSISQPNMFGGAQKPLFGSTGGNAFGGAMTGASAPGNAGGVSFGGFNAGQSGANVGFGGSAFGTQPGQQQAQFQSGFGSSVAPGGQLVPGAGFNPTLQGTFAAVTQQHGATVAPPGANYGTVLYNLQKLQSEIGEQKKLLEQQAKASAANAPKPPGTVSVVVLPSPSLFNFSGGSGRSSVSGYGWSGTISQRTKTRGVAGRIGGTAARVSGAPVRSSPERSTDDIPATLAPSSTAVVRRMSFFSPQNFSGQLKPRTVRASELATPIPATPKMLPLPEVSRSRAIVGSEEEPTSSAGAGDEEGLGSREAPVHTDRNLRPQRQMSSIAQDDMNGPLSRDQIQQGRGNGRLKKGSLASRKENRAVVEDGNNVLTRRRSRNKSSDGAGDADFVWSQERPSAWSLNRPVDSDDQYNPHKYLPSQTRPGFYTVPSMADLASRTMTELQHVENFTVGREGHGEITWVDPVDVRGLDLDVVVDIQRGEVAVYPGKEAQQLDAPARVKLEGMFTKKKKAGDRVSEEELNARYKQKLYNYCSRNGLRFINYDASKGEWSFEVQTFAD